MKSAGSRRLESPAGRRRPPPRRPAAPCRSNRKRSSLPRARGLEPGDDLAQYRVHVAARHRAGGERMVQVADHRALLGEIGHQLAGREQSRIELRLASNRLPCRSRSSRSPRTARPIPHKRTQSYCSSSSACSHIAAATKPKAKPASAMTKAATNTPARNITSCNVVHTARHQAGVYGLVGPPIAFHAECPPVMYFASKPRSRSRTPPPGRTSTARLTTPARGPDPARSRLP